MNARLAVLVTLLLVVPALSAGPASAQLPPTGAALPPDSIEGNVTWDTPHDLLRNVVLQNNSTLTIVGTEVNFENATFLVQPTARLVVLPGTQTPAVLTSSQRGWLRVMGELDLNGTPDVPVKVEGFGGLGATLPLLQGGSVSIQDGIDISTGTMHATYAQFLNYTSGVLVGGTGKIHGHGFFDHVTFDSPYGAGLIETESEISIQDATFHGKGANAFLSISPIPALVRNVTFEGTSTGIGIRDLPALVENVSVSDSEACIIVQAGGGTNLTVHDFDCESFHYAGVELSHPAGSIPSPGRVEFDGARFGTNSSKAAATMFVTDNESIVLRDVQIGPTAGKVDGISVSGRALDLQGVDFEGVGGYDVAWTLPPVDPTTLPRGTGQPGALGWLISYEPTTIHAVDAAGTTVQSSFATTVFRNDNATPIYKSSGGSAPRIGLEQVHVAPDGTVVHPLYNITVSNENGTGTKTDYTPLSPIVVIRFNATSANSTVTSPRPTPWGLDLTFVALSLVALTRRRLS